MIENSTQGLTLLDADHDAQVVGTEHHEATLARWAPAADGRSRRVAVELRVAGDDRTGRWVEVLLDGAPVGGLSPDSAMRHSRHIEAVLARGGRPAANALVRRGVHGPELEIRLPDPAAPVRAPLPPAGPPAERPDASMWPKERRSPRVPLLIGGGVLALLLVVGMVVGSRTGERPTASGGSLPIVVRTTTPTPTPTPTTTTEPVETRTPTTTRAPRATPRRTTVAPTTTTPAPVVPPEPTTTAPAPTTTAEPDPPGFVPDPDCDGVDVFGRPEPIDPDCPPVPPANGAS